MRIDVGSKQASLTGQLPLVVLGARGERHGEGEGRRGAPMDGSHLSFFSLEKKGEEEKGSKGGDSATRPDCIGCLAAAKWTGHARDRAK